MKFYKTVTFGLPDTPTPTRKSIDAAIADATRAVGRRNCTMARVYECDTADIARTADIAVVRAGERIVWSS